MALTELAIKNLKPKDKNYLVSDGGGLSLAVSPSGSKLWRLRYYYQGKEQIMALGKYPAVSLATARKKRDEARDLLEAGKHPAREKKIQKLRQAHEGENTFEKIARRWLEMRGEGLNHKYATQCLTRMELHVFPLIGALPLSKQNDRAWLPHTRQHDFERKRLRTRCYRKTTCPRRRRQNPRSLQPRRILTRTQKNDAGICGLVG